MGSTNVYVEAVRVLRYLQSQEQSRLDGGP